MRRLKRDKGASSTISTGPFDVLSYIFEICGEEDYRSAIKIAVVSRHWRYIVLATPRAWAFMDIKTCTDDEIVQLYFQRSGQQPLHICLPASRSFRLLTNVYDLLQCLSIHCRYGNLIKQVIFVNVTRLRIYGQDFPILVSLLSFSRFPALLHLSSENRWIIGTDGVDLPPLQSLSLVIGTGSSWLRVLEDCKNTLTSLKLHPAALHAMLTMPPVRLPRLQCLDVEYETKKGVYQWPLRLKTPILTTYIEAGHPLGNLPLQLNLENIKYLRIDRVPPLNGLPSLQKLHLHGSPALIGVVLTLLLGDPTIWPELMLIDPGVEMVEQVEQKLTEINQTRPTPIHLTSTLRDSDPPGVIPRSVRYSSYFVSFGSSSYSAALAAM
jgi:hypothetical protein